MRLLYSSHIVHILQNNDIAYEASARLTPNLSDQCCLVYRSERNGKKLSVHADLFSSAGKALPGLWYLPVQVSVFPLH